MYIPLVEQICICVYLYTSRLYVYTPLLAHQSMCMLYALLLDLIFIIASLLLPFIQACHVRRADALDSIEHNTANVAFLEEQVGVICHCHRIIGVVSVDYCIFVYNCVYYCDT
jgi:hypothetical protein